MSEAINLLPQQTPNEQLAKKKQRKAIVIVVVLVAISFIAWVIPFSIVQALHIKENGLNNEISKKQQAIAQLANTERLYLLVYNKASAAKTVFQTQRTLKKDIADMKSIIASGVTLVDFLIDKNKVKTTVNGFDLSLILSYIESLENEEKAQQFLRDVVLSSTTVDKSGGYSVKSEGTFIK